MKREDLFERLDPPPGGLAALRDRLDARRPRRVVPMLAFASVAVAALLLLVFGRRGPDVTARARTHVDTSEIALGLAPMPSEAVAIPDDARGTTALVAVPTKNANVSFYWVQSTDWRD